MINPFAGLPSADGSPVNPNAAPSRYAGLDAVAGTDSDGSSVVFLRRRILPDPASLQTLGEVTVAVGQRLDQVSWQIVGDPLQYWRLCDGNGAMDPQDLEVPGSVLRVTLPPGMGGA